MAARPLFVPTILVVSQWDRRLLRCAGDLQGAQIRHDRGMQIQPAQRRSCVAGEPRGHGPSPVKSLSALRNPQTFVDNIFDGRPEDYWTATESLYRGVATAGSVLIPVLP
jgi:hypothetical protein